MPKAAEAAYAPKANPSDPLALKKEGNEHFKRGSFESAAKCYTTAIDLWLEPKDRAVLYVNRSAARMKQARFLQNRGFSPESVMRLFR